MKNPFIAGKWAQGREFYGRDSIIAELMDDTFQCICLIGNRRIGKTSLLRQIEERVWEDDSQLALFIDLSSIDADLSDIGEEILRQIKRLIRKQTQPEIRMKPALERMLEKSFKSIRDIVDQLADIADASQACIIFLFDESEKLLSFHDPDDRKKIKDLDHLQGALRCQSNVRTILTASKRITRLNEFQKDNTTSPFLHEYTIRYLPPIDDQDAAALICQNQNVDVRKKPFLVEVEPGTLMEIINLTGKHPYWLQFLCRQLFEKSGNLRPIQKSDLLVDTIHMDYFEMDFESLSHHEQVIMVFLGQNSSTTEDEISDHLKKQGINNSRLKSTLMELGDLGFIRKIEDGYVVGNYFLQNWLINEAEHLLSKGQIKTSVTTHTKKLSIKKISKALLITVPKIIGRTILDIFGRDKANDTTAVVLVYAVIAVVILLVWGILDWNTLVDTFKDVWRFFFPVK